MNIKGTTRVSKDACAAAGHQRAIAAWGSNRTVNTTKLSGRTGRYFKIRQQAGADMYATETDPKAYLAVGVSHCFQKDEEGKLEEVEIIEPINATTLECMNIGGKTSFKFVTGVTLDQVTDESDKSFLPDYFHEAPFCDDFVNRATICARTWSREYPQQNLMDIVPLGNSKTDWNYNVDHKRVLNLVHEVTDEDNIKQDKSIDVYGRFDDEKEGEENK